LLLLLLVANINSQTDYSQQNLRLSGAFFSKKYNEIIMPALQKLM